MVRERTRTYLTNSGLGCARTPGFREPETAANQGDISSARRRSVPGWRETHRASIREKPSNRPRQAHD